MSEHAAGLAARLLLASALTLWVGLTLLLSRLRWFARVPLTERLRPYAPGGLGASRRRGFRSVETLADVVAPLARTAGDRLARVVGVTEQLALRLERIHSALDVTAFRMRQLGWAVAGLAAAAGVAAATRPSPAVVLLLLAGAPVLAFLVLEQHVASASSRWQRRVFLELPVVAEQLAMLFSAGYSLGAALNRLAERGHGCCATDLRQVIRRVHQGLSETAALQEWASVVRVDAVDRLVPVLALHGETGDLGRLLSEEARAIRREVQRRAIEEMERRGQLVWVPVTVATLVPGVIFLAVPFVEALRLFSGS
ncbi:MAG TPA: type II secretion system F family protein [Acidimicrobiales bacterium]|nr:type II secretion system F family protein [Acidimicrobiales bacterium]